MSGLFSKPKIVQPKTPLNTAPPVETPQQAMTRQKQEGIKAERGMLKRYGGQGRASTVLTQGKSGKLG